MGLWNPPKVEIDYTLIENIVTNNSANVSNVSTKNIINVSTPIIKIAGINPRRIGLSILNAGDSTVWINTQDVVDTEENFIAYIQPGGYYELPCAFSSELWARTEVATTKLLITDYLFIPGNI